MLQQAAKTVCISCTTQGLAHLVSCFPTCRALHTCKGISGWHRSVVHLRHEKCAAVRLGRAKPVCTMHMPANRLAPPTSHPTEALVQSRLQSPSSPQRCRVEGFSGQLGPGVFNSETNLSSSTFHFTPAEGWCRLSQGLAKKKLAHPT